MQKTKIDGKKKKISTRSRTGHATIDGKKGPGDQSPGSTN